jgi:hypothetical protein
LIELPTLTNKWNFSKCDLIDSLFSRLEFCSIISAYVKDYQMPANEQGLADHISIWGRRRIILRGGNRGVAAAAVDECRVSYGDLKNRCSGGSPHGEG